MHTTYVPDRDLCMLIERFDKSRDGRIAYHEVSLIVPNLVVHFRNDPQLNYYFIIGVKFLSLIVFILQSIVC